MVLWFCDMCGLLIEDLACSLDLYCIYILWRPHVLVIRSITFIQLCTSKLSLHTTASSPNLSSL